MLAGKWLLVSKMIWQTGIFLLFFYDIYFNILGSIGLVLVMGSNNRLTDNRTETDQIWPNRNRSETEILITEKNR